MYAESHITEGVATSCVQSTGPNQNQEGGQDVTLGFSDTSGLGLDLGLRKEEVITKLSLERTDGDACGRESVGNRVVQDVGQL